MADDGGIFSTSPLTAAKARLASEGWCVIERVLDPERSAGVLARLWDAAREFERRGASTHMPVLDPNASNVRVFELLELDAVFRELIAHPLAVDLVRAVVGPQFLISNFTANIARPGSKSMALHSDLSLVIPEPWHDPWAVNIIWCLTDVTFENGATLFVPGSHLWRTRADVPADADARLIPFEAKAGSIIVMDGRMWHTSGANITPDQDRALLFGYYTAPFLRPQVNWNACLSPETQAALEPAMREWLGLEATANTGLTADLRYLDTQFPARGQGAGRAAPAPAAAREGPAPTRDLDQGLRDIREHGLAIVPEVLSGDTLKRAREALYRAAESDRARGREQKFGLDYAHDDTNQRVWNVLSRDPLFEDLAAHPLALSYVRALLGWPALLGNLSANITGPGGGEMVLHADQIFVPEPWAAEPQGLNVAWLLDDFTEDNGATQYVPGSHRLNRAPRPDEAGTATIPMAAPAGSIVVFESRLWHKTGLNRTAAELRAGVFAWYSRPIYRAQENWFLSLRPEVRQYASDDMLVLLGYKAEGLGLVHGASPA